MPSGRWSWSSRPRRTPAARSTETMGDCAYGERRDPPGVRRGGPDARREGAEPRPIRAASRRPPSRSTSRPRALHLSRRADHPATSRRSPAGGGQFRFAAAVCAACPLRAQCVRGTAGGRCRCIHRSDSCKRRGRSRPARPSGVSARRQRVEHRIARLVQLGIRQARYVGRPRSCSSCHGRRGGQPDLPRRHHQRRPRPDGRRWRPRGARRAAPRLLGRPPGPPRAIGLAPAPREPSGCYRRSPRPRAVRRAQMAGSRPASSKDQFHQVRAESAAARRAWLRSW